MSVFVVILVRIQSECGKIRTRTTSNTDTFHAVLITAILLFQFSSFFNLFYIIGLFPHRWKNQKTSGFLILSGIMARDHCHEMGKVPSNKVEGLFSSKLFLNVFNFTGTFLFFWRLFNSFMFLKMISSNRDICMYGDNFHKF